MFSPFVRAAAFCRYSSIIMHGGRKCNKGYKIETFFLHGKTAGGTCNSDPVLLYFANRDEKGERTTKNAFFAMISRMKNIYRWALMRNTRQENLCEHSHEVAVLAHALALIAVRHYGSTADPARCALMAVYHDVPEVLTGDMPTPVKYYDPAIRTAYRQVEHAACDRLLSLLPEDLRDDYAPLLFETAGTQEERRIVKAADKLSALIKCVEELAQGNREFQSARRTCEQAVRDMQLPAADEFLERYLPAYELALDDQ